MIVEGACGELDTELQDLAPALFDTQAEVEECDLVRDALSEGGQRMLDAPGAGGSSIYSEVFAYEIARQCDQAALIKTETEIVYEAPGPITDALIEIDGTRLGLSVKRAVRFPFDQPLGVDDAVELLEEALEDILVSSENVSADDAWAKQILLVPTPFDASLASLQTAYEQIDVALRADTIVWFVRTRGEDDFLYDGDDPTCTVPVPSAPPWALIALALSLGAALAVRRLEAIE